ISMEMPVSFQVNYDPKTFELVKNAPLHIGKNEGGREPFEDAIALPVDAIQAQMSVEEAISKRVSARQFGKAKLPLAQLAKLLYLANAVRKNENLPDRPIYSRNAPSAGGIGSVEIYCFVLNVENVDPGIYHFDSVDHQLRALKKGDFKTWLENFVFYQSESVEPSVVFALTANVAALKSKYGERGYRLALLDTGHVSQNIYLSSTALNLNAFAFGGFVDEEINRALNLDGLDRCTLLCLAVGPKP
ncbi:MAG: SagB/ThcOx family dehydrogenase, partial [Cyanobacteria bacterium]|nr:SagB/ThcOx family dehydrogenase [Cyanobacteriota bacterium]